MKTNETHTPNSSPRDPDQLYAPNGRRIIATKDWIPGNALIASVTRETDGTLDIHWEGETKLCWDGQYTEQLGDKRIFLDDDANEWCEDQLTLGSVPLVTKNPAPSHDDPWTSIPDHPLGEAPDSLIDRDPILDRRIVAKRAILAAYEDSDGPQQSIADLLNDLRHLCDALSLDFAQLDRAAYQRYAAEKSTMSA